MSTKAVLEHPGADAGHTEQVSLATGSAGVVVGPRAKALAADMKYRLGVPCRKIS